MDLRIKCHVVGEDLPPVEAQVFRILDEVGDAFFLDFLQANPVAGFRVVMRLRALKGRWLPFGIGS